MNRVKGILESITSIKDSIVQVYADESLAYHEKNELILDLQSVLIKTQRAACIVMQEELDKIEGASA